MEALRRRLFGRSSEKLDPNQLALDLGAWLAAHPIEAPAELAEPPACEPKTTPRPGHGRRRLPEHLPRHRVEYHPAPGDRVCRECSVELKRIGEEVSEQLDVFDYTPKAWKAALNAVKAA